MSCLLEFVREEPREKLRIVYRCSRCGEEARANDVNPAMVFRRCTAETLQQPVVVRRSPAVLEGPGTELMTLLAAIGILPKKGCDCQNIKIAMNLYGVEGCRDSRTRAHFIKRLQDNYAEHYRYRDLLLAAMRAKKWDALKILRKIRTGRPKTAIARLFDEAIHRARSNADHPAN